MTLKKILIFILLFQASFSWAASLSVELQNPPATGTVALVLFDSANTFSDIRDPARVVRAPLDGRKVYCIEGIPAGEYALMVYYDENNNDRIDRNFIGIPREPLGFSNSYRPKGPPSYSRAVFVVTEEESRHFEVELYRPLGKRGRLGVGVGVIAQSSPYRDSDEGVFQPIPAITYNGENLQISGPRVLLGLWGSGDLRLAASAQYRVGPYEEDDSDFLEGLGDADDTFLAGFALQVEGPGGIEFQLGYEHDVLDEIGGGEARLEMEKSFQHGLFRITPELGVNWLSAQLAENDFGVQVRQATLERPAYDPDDSFSFETGLGLFIELTQSWLFILNTSIELLDNEATNSPLVEDDYVINSFGAVNYVF